MPPGETGMECPAGGEALLAGIPSCLQPAPRAGGPDDRYEVVKGGPRNLDAAPFDYRNPFPLRDAASIARIVSNGARTNPRVWPVDDDRSDRFDYYLNSNAAIGVPGGPECALVDVFGTVRTYGGGWAFAPGRDGGAPALRHRTVADPQVPVVTAALSHEELTFDFTWFMVRPPDAPGCRYALTGCLSFPWADADPEGPSLYVIAQCRIANPGPHRRPAVLRTAFSQRGELCAGAWYMNPRRGPELSDMRLEPGRAERRLLTARAAGAPVVLGCLDAGGLSLGASAVAIDHWPERTLLAPERPADAWQVTLSGELAAGGAAAVTWIIPYYPAGMADAEYLCTAGPDRLMELCRTGWRERHAGRARLRVPEPKVQESFTQALTHLDLCGVALGEVEYPTPGPTCGHHIFYFRDAPDMIYAYDLVGEKARAERMIAHYDRSDPSTESGYFLWLAGAHWNLWQDAAWLPRVLPAVERHMRWLMETWENSREANDGLLPATALGDNEFCRGHYVSYHLYTLAGARASAALASAAGRGELASAWTEFSRQFGESVLRHVDATAARTGGILTPAFEGLDAEPLLATPVDGGDPRKRSGSYGPGGGCDWHNVAAAFPTGILPPDHPVVESSYRRWRHAYVEGLFPYPSDSDYALLHTYNTMNLSGTWLRRGDWAEAVRDLYGVLLHTSGTHAAAEGVQSDLRWDFNNTPHNWFSGKLIRFIRDCLVYEGHDDRLHLFGGLSPAWMKPGEVLELAGAPTTLGPVSLRADMLEDGLSLDLEHAPRRHAAGVILHLPPFLQEVRVEPAAGQAAAVRGGWRLPVGTQRVRVRWRPRPLPDLAFQTVAARYVADYRARAQRSL